jgi:hypothetical protein
MLNIHDLKAAYEHAIGHPTGNSRLLAFDHYERSDGGSDWPSKLLMTSAIRSQHKILQLIDVAHAERSQKHKKCQSRDAGGN